MKALRRPSPLLAVVGRRQHNDPPAAGQDWLPCRAGEPVLGTRTNAATTTTSSTVAFRLRIPGFRRLRWSRALCLLRSVYDPGSHLPRWTDHRCVEWPTLFD